MIKRFVIALTVVLGFASSATLAGKAGSYYNERRLAAIAMIQATLISHGYCDDKNDCTKKRLVFGGFTSMGIDLEVYRVTEPEIIREILAVCVDIYGLDKKKRDVSLRMYHQPHEELMGFAKWYKDPFVKLNLKGEKQ